MPSDLLLAQRWYDIFVWGGILILTAFAMGTLNERKIKKIKELHETYQGLIVILQQLISNDKYTENHCYRVSIYAAKIASYMNLDLDQVEDARSAALLHNFAKHEISRNLLNKLTCLTDEEYKDLKSHTEKGAQVLKPIDGLLRVIPIILAYNEHYDGSGHYTEGKNIPIESRVLAVADVYDSQVSDNSYRKAISPYEAKVIIENGSGTDFDTKVVQAFLKAFSRGDLEVLDTAN